MTTIFKAWNGDNMERRHISWRSPSMGKEMELLIIGHGGTPVLIFPSAHGNFREWDNHGAFAVLEEQAEKGYNQFFCADTFSECFLKRDIDPVSRMKRFNSYQAYVTDELLPFIRRENDHLYRITAGAALGAYAAVLFALKHPDSFNKVIGLCGYYDIRVHMEHMIDDHIYFNNPAEFVPNISDDKLLKSIKNLNIRLINYRNSDTQVATEAFSDLLRRKYIEHQLFTWNKETDDMWKFLPAMLKENLY